MAMKWDWEPLLEFLKEEHNLDIDELVGDPWAPLKDFLKTQYNFSVDTIKADPEAYGKKLAKVVEHCLQADPLIEIFDGMAFETVFVGLCELIAGKE